MTHRFWQHEPDAPWAEFLAIIETYCHPEVAGDAYDELMRIVHLPERSPAFDRFKEELREAIRDPSRIPAGALGRAAQYDDGSPEKFLARLWRDLYPAEPLTGPDERWWVTESSAYFAALLEIIETHCHPEAGDDAYEDLRQIVRNPARPPVFGEFKARLIEAIRDPAWVPVGALYLAAQYDDGSDAKFLARLWRDLYPDEPLSSA